MKTKPVATKKRRRRWPWIALGLLTLGLAWAALATSRLGYESPTYRVVQADGAVELRDYLSMTMVTTRTSGESSRSGMDRGFGSLFRYISGGNEADQKIAMTTPVLVTGGTEADASMSFVLPVEVASGGAPQPSAETLALNDFAGGTVAAIRFRGYRDEQAIAEAEAGLRAWIASAGWEASGKPMLAYYDPPWTPEWLRRNEVLIPVRGSGTSAAFTDTD